MPTTYSPAIRTRSAKSLTLLGLACLLLPVSFGHAATPTLSFTSEGVKITNGTEQTLTLTYPVPVNAAKKKGAISDATPTDTGSGAIVNYTNGGSLTVTATPEGLSLTFADLPTDTKTLYTSLRLGASYRGVGYWKIGAKPLTEFSPVKPADPFLFRGSAPEFDLLMPGGNSLSFRLPRDTYQELLDLREWNTNHFQWHAWMPRLPSASSYTIKITDSPSAPASVAAPKPAPAAPSVTGTRILKWKDGKRAVFMLEFDDSAPTHLTYVIPELKRRGIPGTFYINPGNAPYKDRKAAWEREALSPGIELANHTWTHVGALSVEQLEEELVKTNETIHAAYPDRKRPRLISFGQPGGVPWRIKAAELKPLLAKHHLVSRPNFFGPPWSIGTTPEMLAYIDETISKGTMGHIGFHGVGGDWHSVSKEYFVAMLEKLEASRDRLWLTDPLTWHKYKTERDAATLTVTSSTSDLVRLSLTCATDPELYDQPLTIAIQVPATWKECEVRHADTRLVTTALNGEIRCDLAPRSGEIVVRPAGRR